MTISAVERKNEELILGFAGDTIEATRLMYQSNLYGQLMILIYSAIDSMGLLDAPPSQFSASGASFKAWVKKYLLPQDPSLEFNEVDLWAARCGVLHTFTTQSELSKDAKAKQIQYFSGDKSTPQMNAIWAATREIENGAHVPAHIEDTWMAFCKGVKAFVIDLEANCRATPAYEARLRNVLQQYFLPGG